MSNEMRLQKYIAKAGVASRRKSEEIIVSGKVKVNGEVVTELGTKVQPGIDKVCVNDKLIELETELFYIMLNKPIDYVTTMDDQFERRTVADLVKAVPARVYPIGRLDYKSSGLLLMTNDGDFANHVMHPRNHVAKTYFVTIRGHLNDVQLEKFRTGIVIEDYKTAPAVVEILNKNNNGTMRVKVIISEGKNRQIRKMFDKLNTPVIRLKRVAVGDITLDGLEEGKYRSLTTEEIEQLRR